MRVGAEGKKKPKRKRLDSGRRDCWCCGRVSVGVQWLRWRNEGALAGGWLREEKKLERWGRRLGFGREKKLGLGFFVFALNFSL